MTIDHVWTNTFRTVDRIQKSRCRVADKNPRFRACGQGQRRPILHMDEGGSPESTRQSAKLHMLLLGTMIDERQWSCIQAALGK